MGPNVAREVSPNPSLVVLLKRRWIGSTSIACSRCFHKVPRCRCKSGVRGQREGEFCWLLNFERLKGVTLGKIGNWKEYGMEVCKVEMSNNPVSYWRSRLWWKQTSNWWKKRKQMWLLLRRGKGRPTRFAFIVLAAVKSESCHFRIQTNLASGGPYLKHLNLACSTTIVVFDSIMNIWALLGSLVSYYSSFCNE